MLEDIRVGDWEVMVGLEFRFPSLAAGFAPSWAHVERCGE